MTYIINGVMAEVKGTVILDEVDDIAKAIQEDMESKPNNEDEYNYIHEVLLKGIERKTLPSVEPSYRGIINVTITDPYGRLYKPYYYTIQYIRCIPFTNNNILNRLLYKVNRGISFINRCISKRLKGRTIEVSITAKEDIAYYINKITGKDIDHITFLGWTRIPFSRKGKIKLDEIVDKVGNKFYNEVYLPAYRTELKDWYKVNYKDRFNK